MPRAVLGVHHQVQSKSLWQPFLKIIFEGVCGTGFEGDIAIDDVTLKRGDCPRKPIVPNKAVALPGNSAPTLHKSSLCGLLPFFLYVLLR
uniref:MAM domain-containing glycosylphosphatidylinositol anchor protein 1 n=1 Tax=Sphaerodactylus townsendi TaxID=933632 RepID=A0ACB8GAP3_9SAUR